MISENEGFVAQSNGFLSRFKLDNASGSLDETVITETSILQPQSPSKFIGASLRDVIWFESRTFGFFYNFSEKTTYIIDSFNSYKTFFQADLCGYFAKIFRKDPEEEHLFVLTAKDQISVLIGVSQHG